MRKPKPRKPDLRRIKTTLSYTVPEIADLLDRRASTVTRWIREGLPVLPETRPRLIDGVVLKAWLAEKWAARKRPCSLAELYCCKCRAPRTPDPASVETSPISAQTVMVRGKCGQCGSAMQLARPTANLAEIIAAMTASTQQQERLTGYGETGVKPTIWTGQGSFDFDAWEGDPDHAH